MHLKFPIPYIFCLLTLLLAGIIIWRAAAGKANSKRAWWLHTSASLLAAAFVYMAGTWAYLSWYLRWIFALAWLILVIQSFRKSKTLPTKSESFRAMRPYGAILVILVSGFLLGTFIKGMFYYAKQVHLAWPLKHGRFYVMQGGGSRMTNPMHGNFSWKKFGYAYDIAKLGTNGNRASAIFSEKNEDYNIFGDTVLAPCAGRLIYASDTVNENIPGTLNPNPVHGNYIIIQSGPYRVYLNHLKKGSLLVKQGMRVKTGQPLALQGNTGFSIEPHLHIHAWKNYENDPFKEGTSVPILFDDEFLYMNKVTDLP